MYGEKDKNFSFLNSEPGGDLYSNYLKIETEVLYPHCTLCDFYGKKNSEGNLLLYNNKLVYVLHNTQKMRQLHWHRRMNIFKAAFQKGSYAYCLS